MTGGGQPLGGVLLIPEVLPDLVVGVLDDQVDDLICDQQLPHIDHALCLLGLFGETLVFPEEEKTDRLQRLFVVKKIKENYSADTQDNTFTTH